MELLEVVREFVNTMGFPIVCCYFLYTYIQAKDNMFKDMSSEYDANIDALTSTINSNTQAIAKLASVMETYMAAGKKEEGKDEGK